MKAEHVKKPTGAEFIHITEIPEDAILHASREVAKALPIMGDNNAAAVHPITGEVQRRGRACFLNAVYKDYNSQMLFSDSHHLVQSAIDCTMELDFMPESPLNNLRCFTSYRDGINYTSCILLSAYEDGDYYKSHDDRAMMSALFWLSPNSEFSGGDLVFSQFGERVEAKMGTGVIFPSFYLHEVLPVQTRSNFLTRYTVTCFCV